MRQPNTVRDLVHDYVKLTEIEKLVVNSADFQRLHFVLQNSSAYQTYPSNQHTRFTHSLGVSHLAGKIFVHALKNSRTETLTRFLESAEVFVRKHCLRSDEALAYESVKQHWGELVGNSSRFLHCPPNDDKQIKLDDDKLFLINTIWLAEKICGLVHDIGHLPMSHLFEEALNNLEEIFERHGEPFPGELKSIRSPETVHVAYSKGSSSATRREEYEEATRIRLKALGEVLGLKIDTLGRIIKAKAYHEKRGLRIVHKLKKQLSSNTSYGPYIKLVFSLAETILLASGSSPSGTEEIVELDAAGTFEPQTLSFLSALRSIVASQLDADRLDYTVRDTKSSGLDFGSSIDMNRLVGSATLCLNADEFVIAFSEKALSSIESFFHQRYLTWKYLVYHHNVTRMNAVLEEILKRLIRITYKDHRCSIASIVRSSNFVSIDTQGGQVEYRILSEEFEELFDDSWLRTLLHSVHIVASRDQDAPELADEVRSEYSTLALLADTYLHRKSENLYTVWRNDFDYHMSNTLLATKTTTNSFSISSKIQANQVKDAVKKRKRELVESGIQNLNLYYQYHVPKLYNPQGEPILILSSNYDALIPIDVLSPYVRSLTTVAVDSPNIHMSFSAPSIKSDNDLMARCSSISHELVK